MSLFLTFLLWHTTRLHCRLFAYSFIYLLFCFFVIHTHTYSYMRIFVVIMYFSPDMASNPSKMCAHKLPPAGQWASNEFFITQTTQTNKKATENKVKIVQNCTNIAYIHGKLFNYVCMCVHTYTHMCECVGLTAMRWTRIYWLLLWQRWIY